MRAVHLWAVMVQEQERVKLLDAGSGQGPARDKVADVVTVGVMLLPDGLAAHGLSFMQWVSYCNNGDGHAGMEARITEYSMPPAAQS
jgi:hypothetical protein